MSYKAPTYFQIRYKHNISLSGPWLQDAGFDINAWVSLEVGQGKLALEVVDIKGERSYRKALGMSDEEFNKLLTESM